MPYNNDDSQYYQDGYAQMYANRMRPKVAAEVPAVQLTRDQWDAICEIVRTLTDIYDDMFPHQMETALVQGRAIAPALRLAHDLKYVVGSRQMQEDGDA